MLASLSFRRGVKEHCQNGNTVFKSHNSDLVMLLNISPLDLK